MSTLQYHDSLYAQIIINAGAVYPAQDLPPRGFRVIISSGRVAGPNGMDHYAAFLVRANVDLARGEEAILTRGLWQPSVEGALENLLAMLAEQVRLKLREAGVGDVP